MNSLLKKITQLMHTQKGAPAPLYKNPVLFHWKLLLGLFTTLIVAVACAGFFLYQFFIVQKEESFIQENKKETQFDEKKLKQVIERIEKRQNIEVETGTGTARFIDPSIPF
jgi:hypothetical protein